MKEYVITKTELAAAVVEKAGLSKKGAANAAPATLIAPIRCFNVGQRAMGRGASEVGHYAPGRGERLVLRLHPNGGQSEARARPPASGPGHRDHAFPAAWGPLRRVGPGLVVPEINPDVDIIEINPRLGLSDLQLLQLFFEKIFWRGSRSTIFWYRALSILQVGPAKGPPGDAVLRWTVLNGEHILHGALKIPEK